MMSAPEPTEDPDAPKWDSLYTGWSGTHDYDPRWDYSDELRPEWQSHPLTQLAQRHLDDLIQTPEADEHGISPGRIFAADLSNQGAVGINIHGTGGEPVFLFDPYQHEEHGREWPGEDEDQTRRTIEHEFRHAIQERAAGGEPAYDEDDAEDWLPGHTAAIPDDIKRLLDPGQDADPDRGPIQYLWMYEPVNNKVLIDHNEGKHPAYRTTHKEFHPEVTHESSVRGFAYKIKGGWRITDRDSKEVKDPYLTKIVVAKLEGRPDPTPQEHPRYHGLPVAP